MALRQLSTSRLQPMSSHTTLPSAFVATPVAPCRRHHAAPPTSLNGRRLRLPPCRRVFPRAPGLAPTACLAASRESDPEDEEKLDEAAMRAAEIHEVLSGLKDFKNRIIDDATKLAKKVRAPKKQLEAALKSHPDIVKIDGHIAELEEELKVLGDR